MFYKSALRGLACLLGSAALFCFGTDSCDAQAVKTASSTASIVHSDRLVRPIPTTDSAERSDHPITPALRVALDSYQHIRRDIDGYSCMVTRRENVDGRLGEFEYMVAKVRHERTANGRVVTPFAVYLKFLSPASVKGREVLYVDGQNDGELLARRGGKRFAYITTSLKPTSDLAMRGNRYPVTEFGFENLTKRLIQVAKAGQTTNCSVQFFDAAEINSRPCTGIYVTHDRRAPGATFHQARVFIDEQLNVPVHYAAYDWPTTEEGEPELLEQYTYSKIRINPGFTEIDFDHRNPKYKLKKKR